MRAFSAHGAEGAVGAAPVAAVSSGHAIGGRLGRCWEASPVEPAGSLRDGAGRACRNARLALEVRGVLANDAGIHVGVALIAIGMLRGAGGGRHVGTAETETSAPLGGCACRTLGHARTTVQIRAVAAQGTLAADAGVAVDVARRLGWLYRFSGRGGLGGRRVGITAPIVASATRAAVATGTRFARPICKRAAVGWTGELVPEVTAWDRHPNFVAKKLLGHELAGFEVVARFLVPENAAPVGWNRRLLICRRLRTRGYVGVHRGGGEGAHGRCVGCAGHIVREAHVAPYRARVANVTRRAVQRKIGD